MAHLGPHPTSGRGASSGGGTMMRSNQRLSDLGSYVTETSSVTIPTELDVYSSSGYDVDDDDVSFFDSATSALTGWTEKYPTSHAKNSKSVYSEGGFDSEASGFASERISAITFDNEHGSVEASLYDIDDEYSKKQHHEERESLAVIPSIKGKKYCSPSFSSQKEEDTDGHTIASSSSVKSVASNSSIKRAPVPPLRDPNMEDKEEDQMWEEDCNYDINPSLVFLVLESRNWEEAIALLDGKGLENKNGLLNLGQLFGGYRKDQGISDELAMKRQKELRSQARTWIVRRERTGVLRWRMLPLHAALAFNAPFDVVLRLYHLYPGAIRCRNDQGMLPLHHCFKYGNEDKILEFLLDVFPEALTVMDDKGRLPLGCTPKDGSDNERRSNILILFANFQVEMSKKVNKTTDTTDAAPEAAACTVPQARRPIRAQEDESTLIGAVPRYTPDTDYNQVIFSSIKPTSTKDKEVVPSLKIQQGGEDDVDGTRDRYAMLNFEDGENVCLNKKHMVRGLMTIPENDILWSKTRSNLKSELLELSEKNKRRGLKKLFGKKRVLV
ncbi:hypothetical protein ACHAXA_004220 [Cyclostephanos tholiformis]|uniref:Uncharacterized protein n=1 Tax=Cyclostephanos tholiformis TaxID=382380 RepID=A0ABD3RAA4_9STRA